MNVEWFLKLKEIDSLTKMRTNALRGKSEQDDRLSKLSNLREEKLSQTAKLKQDLIALRDKLAQVESKLKTASEQKQRLIDLGGDEKKIQDFTNQMSSLEDEGFLFMGQEEELEAELTDIKTFLAGLEKTHADIRSEVEEANAKTSQEVANLDLRLKLLTEELPDDFRTTLSKITAKNLAHGPFTRVEQGSCYVCRYKISRIEESEIDMQKALKTCPQCSRIFLPYGS